MYSPQMTWGEIAKMFLQKKETPGGLHDFQNNILGEPWQERAATIRNENILDLRDKSYRLRECPLEPVLVTLCADVGEKETHWTVEARNETGESWVIDYGTVLAPEDLIAPSFLKARQYPTPSGKIVRPTAGLIDSGFNTERVYSVCSASDRLLWPYKGSDAAFGLWSASEVKGTGLILYVGVDYTLKTALYLDRIQKKLPPLLHLPADTGRDFIQGLSGQQLMESKTNKSLGRFWKPVRADHFGDCVKMSMLTWWIMKDSLTPPAQEAAA
jgi:phage terminase large subunit GpA-like protein